MFEFVRMNLEQSFLLKMVVYAFVLLSLVQFPSILASGFEIHSKVCGTAHLAYSHFHGHQLFYLNGKYVDNNSFCKALCFHYANDCIFEGQHGCRCNGFDLSSADLPLKRRRKLLQKDVAQDEPSKEKKKNPTGFSTVKQVSVAATGIVGICCSLLCPCFHRKRKATSHTVIAKDPISMDSGSSFDNTPVSEKVPPSPFRVPPSPRFSASPQVKRVGSVRLDLNQIVRATQNFSASLRIGEGGFGTVYKGQLENGQVVAVKRARKEHCESLRTEFRNEIELLSKIDHRSLVKLLGYIEQGDERLIITEYVPSGTLREHLDGQRGRILDFSQRLEIVIDVAHALTYLHTYSEKQIIHRDVKSSNILLTESKRAKVADFGFARLGPMDSDKTHISTIVKGTLGYLDPEYMKTYQVTPRSDVYSFGILLLEILTGRRPVEVKRAAEEHVTIRWAFRKYSEGAVVDMVDPLMEDRVHGEVLMKIFALAFECAAPIRIDRPDMKIVGEKLWVIRADYVKSKKA